MACTSRSRSSNISQPRRVRATWNKCIFVFTINRYPLAICHLHDHAHAFSLTYWCCQADFDSRAQLILCRLGSSWSANHCRRFFIGFSLARDLEGEDCDGSSSRTSFKPSSTSHISNRSTMQRAWHYSTNCPCLQKKATRQPLNGHQCISLKVQSHFIQDDPWFINAACLCLTLAVFSSFSKLS